MNDTRPLEEISIPKIADQSTAFAITSNIKFGELIKPLCFRTGRLVPLDHAVGTGRTEDLGLQIRLADRMLKRVDAAFDGNPLPSVGRNSG